MHCNDQNYVLDIPHEIKWLSHITVINLIKLDLITKVLLVVMFLFHYLLQLWLVLFMILLYII